MPIKKAIAVYMRVSKNSQNLSNQEPDIKNWLKQNNEEDLPVVWYKEKASATRGRQLKWEKMQEAVKRDQVEKVVVWRLDRLGRKIVRLAPFIELLLEKKVELVSIREGISQSTPMGRAMILVLLVLAQMESEIISERTKAGIVRSRPRKKRKDRKSDNRKKQSLTPKQIEKRKKVRELVEGGMKVIHVCRLTHTDPKSVYKWIAEEGWNYQWKDPEKRKMYRDNPLLTPPSIPGVKNLSDLLPKDKELDDVKAIYGD